MLLFLAFVLFIVLCAAWLAAPTSAPAAPTAAPSADGMLPEARTSAA